MKTYLVGGAVRDQLLGEPIGERDWVVVGSTPEDMIKQGFKPVGKDFPVFLHPETYEAYALARTERKVGHGYHGFTFYAAPDVTLEDDLKRRDLTINAIAQTENGGLIDPFHGQHDLKNRILKHVSKAFVEDPVRILRVARFAARLGDFKVAPETNLLMQSMVASGEVNSLMPERVFQEFNRALAYSHPERFFDVLRDCGALAVIFPEVEALFHMPQKSDLHPEGNAGLHTMLTLQMAVKFHASVIVRFALLVHDFGKVKTARDQLPSHTGHESQGVEMVETFCRRLRVPHPYRDLAILVTRYHGVCHDVLTLEAETILKALKKIDPFRKPARFENFLLACQIDSTGRAGFEDDPYPQADIWREIYQRCAAIDVSFYISRFHGVEIGKAIDEVRVKVIRDVVQDPLLSSKKNHEAIYSESRDD